MHKISDLMTALGFNDNASDEVKKAFINHLVRQAFGASRNEKSKDFLSAFGPSHDEAPARIDHLPARKPEQLEFNFEEPHGITKKKPA